MVGDVEQLVSQLRQETNRLKAAVDANVKSTELLYTRTQALQGGQLEIHKVLKNYNAPVLAPFPTNSVENGFPKMESIVSTMQELEKDKALLIQDLICFRSSFEFLASQHKQLQRSVEEHVDQQRRCEELSNQLKLEQEEKEMLRMKNLALQDRVSGLLSVMRQAVDADDEDEDEKLIHGLIIENASLRNLLHVSQLSVPTAEDINHPNPYPDYVCPYKPEPPSHPHTAHMEDESVDITDILVDVNETKTAPDIEIVVPEIDAAGSTDADSNEDPVEDDSSSN
eukprot:GILK01004650.1.p1 GENE.GILK01004650.1~~GILK01004650.1.p1  ORF type:complete len:283 (-),score=47.23 GILK01004650.1:210-1058(-)